jgi:hypothetical protein
MSFATYYYNSLSEGDGVVGMVPAVQQSGPVSKDPNRPLPYVPKRDDNKREKTKKNDSRDTWHGGAHNNTVPVRDEKPSEDKIGSGGGKVDTYA